MSRKRVLFILHNHPSISPGGTEAYAMEVYRALQQSQGFEPMVLARADPDSIGANRVLTNTSFSALGSDPNELLALIPEEQYDKFFMRMHDRARFVRDFTDFLRSRRPDVVHFQHTLFLGAELISAVRRVLPQAAIVFTLHEYLPICNHYGQLVRTNGDLCMMESPRRCNQCFPQHAPQEFYLRKRLIQSHFEQVDLFIAPSRFLLERYVEWGIPQERIRYEPHGFVQAPLVHSEDRSPRSRFAFFGVLTPFKGIEVALRAMEMLGPEFEGRLRIYGASYAEQPEELRVEIERLLEATRATVTYAGPYEHAALPGLMAETDWIVVPSIWWENAPLVIQEAFMHRRPVICSDIGGMAEHVQHGLSGLQFSAGDPAALARTFREAVEKPELWDALHTGIPRVRTMEEHLEALRSIYLDLIERRAETGRATAGIAG